MTPTTCPASTWWLGYMKAGDRLYWWTTAIAPHASRHDLARDVQRSVSSAAWAACTTDIEADPQQRGNPAPAFVAAGSVDWDTVEPILQRFTGHLPGSPDTEQAALRDAMAREQRMLRDAPPADATPEDLISRQISLAARQARHDHEIQAQSLRRAWSGPLVDPSTGTTLFAELGDALLPAVLREYLAATPGSNPGAPPATVVIAPASELGAVPWELLAVDGDGTMLIERARTRGGISPASLVNLARPASPDEPDGPALRILDPGSPDSPGGRPVYPSGLPASWIERHDSSSGDVTAGREWIPIPTGGTQHDSPATSPRLRGCTREEFSELLRSRRWGRILFLGHVSSADTTSPTATALVMERSRRQRAPKRTDDGRLLEQPRATDRLSARVWLHSADEWPLPRRVAFIACQADDNRYVEQLGLTLAALNAGARLVATTRWPLPTDRTAALIDTSTPLDDGPTTRVALAVDDALAQQDTAGHFRRWQLAQLRQWRQAGTEPERRLHAPLLWASIVMYEMPDDITG